MNDNNSTRRGIIKKAAAIAGTTLTLGVGTASAKLSNEQIREIVKNDFYVWNHPDVPIGRLDRNYRSLFSWQPWNATKFAGPSFAGAALILTGNDRAHLWLHEYKAMVEMLRQNVEPVGEKLIRETSHFVREEEPRSGGEWVMHGRIGGREFKQKAVGRHWWEDGKITTVKVRGFNFAEILKQIA